MNVPDAIADGVERAMRELGRKLEAVIDRHEPTMSRSVTNQQDAALMMLRLLAEALKGVGR